MGINGLSIGTESGEDDTLALAGKGYSSKDILEQCRKLDEAGIEYYFVYMTGLAGKGNGYRNARKSAELFSKLNPYFISVDSLTLFHDTEIYHLAQKGKFVPAGEKERILELMEFIKNLHIRTHLFANSRSNFYPVTAYLPKEREAVISELRYVIDTMDEREMEEYKRDFLIDFPVEKTVAFQFPQLLCQGGLSNPIQTAHQFPKPLDFVKRYIP